MPENVTVYLDWWPRQIAEIDQAFTSHGWVVKGGVEGRSPRKLGAGLDATQIVAVVSAGTATAYYLTQLVEKIAHSMKRLLRDKRPDEKVSVNIDIALDGQPDGDDFQRKWQTGRYLMITLPHSQGNQIEALESLERIEVPLLPDSGGNYMPWELRWGQHNQWVLCLTLRTKQK